MAFTHIQGALGGPSSPIVTIHLGAAPTPGNLVCVGLVKTTNTLTIATCIDSNNNVYTATPNSPSGFQTGGGAVWLFYLLKAPVNASATITITYGTGSAEAWADEFSYSGTCFFDTDAKANTGTHSVHISTPSITPTYPNSLLYATAAAVGSITHPIAGGILGSWTGATGGIYNGDMSEYDLNASSATSVDFTQTPTDGWSAMAMAFYSVSNNPSGSWMFFGVGNT